MIDPLKGWVVGTNGKILKTENGGEPVSVENKTENIVDFYLFNNYPNPFNSSTNISWQSPVSDRHTIKLLDVLGREIDIIVDDYYEAGYHSTLYNINSTLPSSVYFYRLQTKDFVSTKKMIYLK